MNRVTDAQEGAARASWPTGEPLDLGLICSFSIPIITICALIVLMIFVILLNIVFWWLPFFRICFPVPLKGERVMTCDPRTPSLGRGISFPPRVGADGRVAWSEGEQNIRESIRVILRTEPGERLRLPRLRRRPAAASCSSRTRPRPAARSRTGSRRRWPRWEPRIAVEAVDVEADPDDPRGRGRHHHLPARRDAGAQSA